MRHELTRREFLRNGLVFGATLAASVTKSAEASYPRTILYVPGIYSDPKNPEFLKAKDELALNGVNLQRLNVNNQDCVNRRSYLNKMHQAIWSIPGKIDLAGYSQGGGVIQMYLDEYAPVENVQPKVENVTLIAARNLYKYDAYANLGTEAEVPNDLKNFYRRIASPHPLLERISGQVKVFYGTNDRKIPEINGVGLAFAYGITGFPIDADHGQIVSADNFVKML